MIISYLEIGVSKFIQNSKQASNKEHSALAGNSGNYSVANKLCVHDYMLLVFVCYTSIFMNLHGAIIFLFNIVKYSFGSIFSQLFLPKPCAINCWIIFILDPLYLFHILKIKILLLQYTIFYAMCIRETRRVFVLVFRRQDYRSQKKLKRGNKQN